MLKVYADHDSFIMEDKEVNQLILKLNELVNADTEAKMLETLGSRQELDYGMCQAICRFACEIYDLPKVLVALEPLFRSWEYYAGSDSFPVPYAAEGLGHDMSVYPKLEFGDFPSDPPSSVHMYVNTTDKYEGGKWDFSTPHGECRRDLVEHIIRKLLGN